MVFSMPYLYDFATGIVTIVLMSRIATFNTILHRLKSEDEESRKKLLDEEIEKISDKYSYAHLKTTFANRELSGSECIICLDRPRSVLNRPCNDILMCEPCSETLLSKSLFTAPTCPKCRRNIEHFEKFYT